MQHHTSLRLLSHQLRRRGYSISTPRKYDVVVVGGGMVGTAMALALQRSRLTNQLKVALIDAQKPDEKEAAGILDSKYQYKRENLSTLQPGLRVSALTRASQLLLERIGAWDKLKPFTDNQSSLMSAYDKMEVWDETGGGILRFNAAEIAASSSSGSATGFEPNLGHNIENELIHASLLASLADGNKDQVSAYPTDIILGEGIKDIDIAPDVTTASKETLQWASKLGVQQASAQHQKAEDVATLVLSSGERLHANLVIAADGGNSFIRTRLNMPLVHWNYNIRAFVCCVETEADNTTAYQRFLKTGPIALLPLGRRAHNIVWSTTPEHAKFLQSLSNEQLIEAINVALFDTATETTNDNYSNPVDRAIRGIERQADLPKTRFALWSTGIPPRPPRVTKVLEQRANGLPDKASFPLQRLHATQYVKQHVALIGDAAHCTHPLAGQGVNMGLVDVIQLTKAIQVAIESGMPLGSELLLKQEYEKVQFGHNEIMLDGMEAVRQLFAVNHDNLPGFPFLRALGLLGLDKGPSFIKEKLIKVAMGVDFDVSHLGAAAKKP